MININQIKSDTYDIFYPNINYNYRLKKFIKLFLNSLLILFISNRLL